MQIVNKLKGIVLKKRTLKNTLLYLIEQGAQKVFALLIITLIARNITTEEFGLYGLIFTLYKFLPLVFSFGYSRALGRLYIENAGEDKASAIFTIICFFNLGVIFSYVLFDYYGMLNNVWADQRLLSLSYYVLICIFLNSLSEMFLSIFQIIEDAKSIVMVQIIAYVLQFLFVLSFSVLDTLNIEKVMISIIIYELFLILGYNYLKEYKFNPSVNLQTFCSNLSFALPFIIYSGAIWIFQISDRWILQYFRDLEEVGIYTLAFQLGNIAIWVAQPLNKSLAPRIDKSFVQNGFKKMQATHNRFLPFYLIVAVISILFTSAFGILYLIFIAPDQYQRGIPIMLILVLGGIFRILYLPFINIIRALKKTYRVAVGSAIFMGVNLILNFILIPWLGMYGASLATLLSNIGLLFLYVYFVHSFDINTKFKGLNLKQGIKELIDEVKI